MTNYSLLDKHDLETLSEALYFMKIAELKKACLFLSLSEEGNKNEMIERK